MAKSVAIIGAGAAGLLAADRLSAHNQTLKIHLFDAMPSPARKILMAGKSGLNISHQTGLTHPEDFSHQYGGAASWMRPMLENFGTREILQWMEGLGQEHFTGSSGRLFPKTMKASPLLRALMKRLEARGVKLHSRHRWTGWTDKGLLTFETNEGPRDVEANACLLALGGPSWPRLGTDGLFLEPLAAKGIQSIPYQPSNCGFDVALPLGFGQEWAGTPLKSVGLSFGGRTVRGDVMISLHENGLAHEGISVDTKSCGLQGGPVYILSASIRDAITQSDFAELTIDLRPNLSLEQVKDRLSRPRGKQSISNHLRKSLKLQGVQAALVKAVTSKETMSDMNSLAAVIKALPIKAERTRPISEAISTSGGVLLSELDEWLMVKHKPGLFIAGEMLDWEAPTGGYLLTGCLSQGARAAEGVARYLDSVPD